GTASWPVAGYPGARAVPELAAGVPPTELPGATVPGATVACVAACVECTKQLGPGLYALSRSPHMVQCRSLVEYFRTGLRVAPPGRVPATTRALLLCAGPSKVRTDPSKVGRSG